MSWYKESNKYKISYNLVKSYHCKTLVILPKWCKEKRTWRQVVVYCSTKRMHRNICSKFNPRHSIWIILPYITLIWLHTIFSHQQKCAFKAPTSCKYITKLLVHYLCSFCTCCLVGFYFQICHKVAHFHTNFEIRLQVKFEIIVYF